jgi:hypothetical protein
MGKQAIYNALGSRIAARFRQRVSAATWVATGMVVAGALLVVACSPVRSLPAPTATQATTQTVAQAVPVTPTPDRWQEIRQWSPYPYTTPLPPVASTPLDGVYVRFDPRTDVRPPCRRCPPYPPEGGVWKLEFDQGVFRVYHPVTGWRTLGSFTVQDDHVTLFNDPQCHLAVGEFIWRRNDDGLHFQLVGDDCELGTRAKNFTAQAWASCQPPNHEAAVTGHWKTPAGC